MTAEDVAHVDGADADDDDRTDIRNSQYKDVVAVNGNVTSQLIIQVSLAIRVPDKSQTTNTKNRPKLG